MFFICLDSLTSNARGLKGMWCRCMGGAKQVGHMGELGVVDHKSCSCILNWSQGSDGLHGKVCQDQVAVVQPRDDKGLKYMSVLCGEERLVPPANLNKGETCMAECG